MPSRARHFDSLILSGLVATLLVVVVLADGKFSDKDFAPMTSEQFSRVLGLDQQWSLEYVQQSIPRMTLEKKMETVFANPGQLLDVAAATGNFTHSARNSTTSLVSGASGMGKTVVAIRYAVRHADKYDAVLWFPASSKRDLYLAFHDHAKAVGLLSSSEDPEDGRADVLGGACAVCKAVRDWMQSRPAGRRVLAVYDNVNFTEFTESLEDLFLPLPENERGVDVILTSQDRTLVAPAVLTSGLQRNATDVAERLAHVLQGPVFDVAVGPVTPEEGDAILCAEHKACTTDEDHQAARRVSRAVGGWPFALGLFRDYMTNEGVNPKTLQEMLVSTPYPSASGTGLLPPMGVFDGGSLLHNRSEHMDKPVSLDMGGEIPVTVSSAQDFAGSVGDVPASAARARAEQYRVVPQAMKSKANAKAKAKEAEAEADETVIMPEKDGVLDPQSLVASLVAASVTRASKLEQEVLHLCAHLSNNVPEWLLRAHLETISSDAQEHDQALQAVSQSHLLTRTCHKHELSGTEQCDYTYTMHDSLQKLLLEAEMFAKPSKLALKKALQLLNEQMKRFQPEDSTTWHVGNALADHVATVQERALKMATEDLHSVCDPDSAECDDQCDAHDLKAHVYNFKLQSSLQLKLISYDHIKMQEPGRLLPQAAQAHGQGARLKRGLPSDETAKDSSESVADADTEEDVSVIDDAMKASSSEPSSLLHDVGQECVLSKKHAHASPYGSVPASVSQSTSTPSVQPLHRKEKVNRMMDAFQHVRMADAFYRAGQYDAALSNLNRSHDLFALEMGPQHPIVGDIHYHMGLVHHAKGEFQQASERLQDSIAINKRMWGTGLATQMRKMHTECEWQWLQQVEVEEPSPYLSLYGVAVALLVVVAVSVIWTVKSGDRTSSVARLQRRLPLLLWSDTLKLDLLVQTSDVIKAETTRDRHRNPVLGPIGDRVEALTIGVLGENGWEVALGDDRLRQDLFPSNTSDKRRQYNPHSLVHLVRAIRNKWVHRCEYEQPLVGDGSPSAFLNYFSERFPKLVPELHAMAQDIDDAFARRNRA